MKYIILFFLPLCLLCGDEIDDLLNTYTAQDIIEFIGEAIIEPIEKTFSKISGSENFMRQFSLNSDEQKMIGIWGFNGIVTSPKGGDGPGTSICFLPNRYFYVYKGSRNDIGYIKYIVGYWKVESSMLMVRFICRLKILEAQSKNINEKYSIEYMDDYTYYSIFTVPEYKGYYINRKPFDWTIIPEEICEFYQIKNNDSPRGRLLFDTLGVPPGDLREAGSLGKFLLNPRITDEYILELIDVW
jgi:hypothetical protein